MRVVSAGEMRALDARTIASGTPGATLMERAGQGVAAVAARMLGRRRGPVVVVCGRGNNGGDGFVAARHLRRRGRTVEVWLLGTAEQLRGDAAQMAGRWRSAGGGVQRLDDDAAIDRFASRCRGAALVVDALLGTGLNAPIAGRTAAVVERMNAAERPILAVDIASGLSADTGMPLGGSVRATATATFAFLKIGQCLYPGVERSGAVEVIDIGIEDAEVAPLPRSELLEPAEVGALLPRRRPDAHKGRFGHALVVAGSRGKLGAALLTTEATARSGAGLVTLAVAASLQPLAEGRVVEAMTEALPDDGHGSVEALPADRLDDLLAGRTCVVCGPGLGQAPGARALVAQLTRAAEVPLVLDADGLNVIAGTGALRGRRAPTVLTPHPGEMARLVGGEVPAVQADRVGNARALAADVGAVVVLKGARTVVAAPDGRVGICPAGNPGLAAGGSGDVLAGVVAAGLAQGLAPYEAACFAVMAHARAADAIAARRGEVGLLARDLLAELPAAIARLQEQARS